MSFPNIVGLPMLLLLLLAAAVTWTCVGAAPVQENYNAVEHGIVQFLLKQLLAGIIDSQDDDY